MAEVRRVDHIAIVVADTETAKAYFSRQFGLAETHSEVLESPYVRLTYLDAGNVSIQLVEPLDAEGAPAAFLATHGPGLHHLCFGVDDVLGGAARAGAGGVVEGNGRGRVSAFVPGESPIGVPIEFTEFKRDQDVDGRSGWLEG